MNLSDMQKKERGSIKLGGFAFVRKMPERVYFGNHGVPIERMADDPGFTTGVYATSNTPAMWMANDQADANGEQVLRLLLHYAVRGGMPPLGAIDRAAALATGFFHIGRLSEKFRAEIRDFLLENLRRTLLPGAFASLEDVSLDNILVRYPELVRVLLNEEPLADVVVYAAVPAYASQRKRQINVATVRTSRAWMMAAQVVYLEKSITATGGRADSRQSPSIH
ncbi:MAG: hypothetical protein ABI702_15840 [Burkholderiales bacterium]